GPLLLLDRRAMSLIVRDELWQRLLRAVEEQVIAELALPLWDLGVGSDVCRIDYRRVQPRLHRMVKEDAIERGAGVGRDAKGDVAYTQDGQYARQRRLDAADALQCLEGAVAQLLLPRRHWEGQRVEEQRLGVETVLLSGDIVHPFGDGELLLRRPRHALLVNRQGHHCRAVLARQWQHRIHSLPPVLQVDRVDDCAAWIRLQRSLDD